MVTDSKFRSGIHIETVVVIVSSVCILQPLCSSSTLPLAFFLASEKICILWVYRRKGFILRKRKILENFCITKYPEFHRCEFHC